MTGRELTAQQTDPVGALNQRPVTLVIAFFGVAFAIVRTAFENDSQTSLPLAVAAIASVVVAAALVVIASSPYRAPFTRQSFVVVTAFGCLAVVVEALASLGHDGIIRDDWGGIVLGLLLLACSPFRPGGEIAVATVVGALLVGAVVFVELPFFTTPAPPPLFFVVGITPVVALGIGSAVYSSTFVSLVSHWMVRASSLTVEDAREMRPGIARSVQQDRVTGLNQEVVPFFTELLERGVVTDDDRRRAGEVATVIRQRIVAESDRSWLQQVLIDVSPRGETGTIIDRAHLAESMDADQRTAVRAVLQAVAVDPDARSSSLGIVLHGDASLVRALVRVESASADVAIRQHYAPYFAVLRILFRDFQVDVSGSFLTLRFSYDQH